MGLCMIRFNAEIRIVTYISWKTAANVATMHTYSHKAGEGVSDILF